MSIEILTKKRKREIFGPENLVPPTRDIGNQEQDQSSMGDLPQIQTRIDIKKLHAQSSIAPFRCHSFSDSLLRSRNMDTEQRTRKNDSTRKKKKRRDEDPEQSSSSTVVKSIVMVDEQ